MDPGQSVKVVAGDVTSMKKLTALAVSDHHIAVIIFKTKAKFHTFATVVISDLNQEVVAVMHVSS